MLAEPTVSGRRRRNIYPYMHRYIVRWSVGTIVVVIVVVVVVVTKLSSGQRNCRGRWLLDCRFSLSPPPP